MTTPIYELETKDGTLLNAETDVAPNIGNPELLSFEAAKELLAATEAAKAAYDNKEAPEPFLIHERPGERAKLLKFFRAEEAA